MKNLIITFTTSLFFSTAALGQEVKPDSIAAFLCKKWKTDYAIVGGEKIGSLPGWSDSNYEFSKDRTYVITENGLRAITRGLWTYMPQKKMIRLVVNGKHVADIVSLKNEQFVLLPNLKDVPPGEPTSSIKIVFKVKSD